MQKHVTLNEALMRLDALVQTLIGSRKTSAHPGSSEEGVPSGCGLDGRCAIMTANCPASRPPSVMTPRLSPAG